MSHLLYRPVRTSSDGSEDAEIEGSDNTEKPCYKASSLLRTTFPLLLCIVCTFVNILVPLYSSPNPISNSSSHLPITRADIPRLRRPSQYIRFDSIPCASPPIPKQLNTYPVLIAPVDAHDAGLALGIEGEERVMHMVKSGTISPEDRRIRASNTVSTVIQFRAIDWGMETCELQLVLPARAHVQTSAYPFTLTLFRLNATSTSPPLSARMFTYAHRPARISKVAAIEAHPASWYTQASESTSEPGSTTN